MTDQTATSSSFQFQSYDQACELGHDNLKTQSNDKQQSSLLTLELQGHLIQKLADYLNASVDELQAYELREKNLMAVNTIEFIDSQLVEIEYDLKQSEIALEQFSAENLIVDLGLGSRTNVGVFHPTGGGKGFAQPPKVLLQIRARVLGE